MLKNPHRWTQVGCKVTNTAIEWDHAIIEDHYECFHSILWLHTLPAQCFAFEIRARDRDTGQQRLFKMGIK